MFKKYSLLLIAIVFTLGASSHGLCLTVRSPTVSNCCQNNASGVSTDAEKCLSRCIQQKATAIKTDSCLKSSSKTPFFLENKFYLNHPHNFLLDLKPFTDFYINHTISKLDISQIYFSAIFNHAPPFSNRFF